MKLLYEQMDQAYRRAFVDEANGAALDNVVALLNVTRNPALKARGEVTFFLKSATDRNVPIPAGTGSRTRADAPLSLPRPRRSSRW